jgi:hypothetical protein
MFAGLASLGMHVVQPAYCKQVDGCSDLQASVDALNCGM